MVVYTQYNLVWFQSVWEKPIPSMVLTKDSAYSSISQFETNSRIVQSTVLLYPKILENKKNVQQLPHVVSTPDLKKNWWVSLRGFIEQ